MAIIGSDNGLSPVRRQTIASTIDDLLLSTPLRTNFNQNMLNFCQDNAFENIVCKILAILSRPRHIDDIFLHVFLPRVCRRVFQTLAEKHFPAPDRRLASCSASAVCLTVLHPRQRLRWAPNANKMLVSCDSSLIVQSTPVISRLLGAKIRERELSGSPVMSREGHDSRIQDHRPTLPGVYNSQTVCWAIIEVLTFPGSLHTSTSHQRQITTSNISF